jgi:hypothetical protein
MSQHPIRRPTPTDAIHHILLQLNFAHSFPQRVTYSLISSADILMEICDIHLFSSNAFCTVKFFLLAFLNNVGAIAFSVRTSTQDEV